MGVQHKELSPLALPFEDALNLTKLSQQLRIASDHRLRQQLAHFADPTLRPAIVSAKIVTSNRGVQVIFKGGIPKSAAFLKDRSGSAIPTLIDAKKGTFLKNARVLGRSGKIAKAGATAALAAVEVAHVISGHDNAKRLRKVDRAVEGLVQAHEAELRARLEAIYRHSKELLSGVTGLVTENDRAVLYQQCRDLIELRSRWRHQFLHELKRLERADAGLLNNIFFWRKEEGRRRARVARATEANASMEVVQLMHFSLLLQTSLATAAGKIEQFRGVTLPDEVAAWRALQKFAECRVDEIAGAKAKEFRPFLNAIDDLGDEGTASVFRSPSHIHRWLKE